MRWAWLVVSAACGGAPFGVPPEDRDASPSPPSPDPSIPCRAPLLACDIANRIEVGTIATAKVSREVFSVAKIGPHAVVIAAPAGMNAFDHLFLWFVDTSSDAVTPANPIGFGGMIAWVGAITGGIGVLVFEEQQGLRGWSMYRLAPTPNAVPVLTGRATLAHQEFFGAVVPAHVIELGLDDYFVVAANWTLHGAEDPITERETVAIRLRASPSIDETVHLSTWAIAAHGSQVRAYGAIPWTTSNDAITFQAPEAWVRSFDIESAKWLGDSTTGPNLIVADAPGFKLASADMGATLLRLRVGIGTDPQNLVASSLPQKDLVGSATAFRWARDLLVTSPSRPAFGVATGASFALVARDASVRVRTTLLSDTQVTGFSATPIDDATCFAPPRFAAGWFVFMPTTTHVFFGDLPCDE